MIITIAKIVAFLSATSPVACQWVQSFPSYLEPRYMPFWKVESRTQGIASDGSSVYALVSTKPTIAGGPNDRNDAASFTVATGERLNASTQDYFAVMGAAPGGRYATPGALFANGAILTTGYTSIPGSDVTNFGVFGTSNSSLLLQTNLGLVTGQMLMPSAPFPDQQPQGLAVKRDGTRYVIFKTPNDVLMRVYPNQAAFVANSSSAVTALGIANASDVTSVVLDELRNRLWLMSQTSNSTSVPGSPPQTTWTPVVTRVDLSSADFASISIPLPRRAGAYPYGSQFPLLTVLPASGDVVMYTQTVEDCGRACTAKQTAIVSRLDLQTGAVKWIKQFPEVKAVNNLVSDSTGQTVLRDWNAMNAADGEPVTGLPALIRTPNPFSTTNQTNQTLMGRQLQQPSVEQIIPDATPNSWFFTSTNDNSNGVNQPTNYLSIGRVQLGKELTALPFVPPVRPTTVSTTTTSTGTTATTIATSSVTTTTVVSTTSGVDKLCVGLLLSVLLSML